MKINTLVTDSNDLTFLQCQKDGTATVEKNNPFDSVRTLEETATEISLSSLEMSYVMVMESIEAAHRTVRNLSIPHPYLEDFLEYHDSVDLKTLGEIEVHRDLAQAVVRVALQSIANATR